MRISLKGPIHLRSGKDGPSIFLPQAKGLDGVNKIL